MPKIDFVSGTLGWRRRHGGGRGQAVSRAVGIKSGATLPRVLDCTAGLGRDAFLLASLGCEVLALERNSQIFADLQKALAAAEAHPETAQALGGRLQFQHANAITELKSLTSVFTPDVIYLDPMHPPRKKSALVKQELRELRELVGNDPDSQELAKIALSQAVKRVVIKRPAKSEPLHLGVHHAHRGKTTRFDIYLPN